MERLSQVPKRAQGDSATNPAGATSLTLVQLKATRGTYPAGLAQWHWLKQSVEPRY